MSIEPRLYTLSRYGSLEAGGGGTMGALLLCSTDFMRGAAAGAGGVATGVCASGNLGAGAMGVGTTPIIGWGVGRGRVADGIA